MISNGAVGSAQSHTCHLVLVSPCIMGDSTKQMTKPVLSLVCAVFFLAVPAAVCALIALLGVWWSGQVEPGTLSTAISGKGDLSLWWFRSFTVVGMFGFLVFASVACFWDVGSLVLFVNSVGGFKVHMFVCCHEGWPGSSSALLGIRLPQAYMNLDSVCLDAISMCDKLAVMRNLIGASFGFAGLATLSAVMSLFAVGECFGDGRRIGLFGQVVVCLASAVSCGCMIAGLVVGESTDTLEWFRQWGTFGPAVYCAAVSLGVSFVTVIVSVFAARRIKEDMNKGAREFHSESSESTEVAEVVASAEV